MAYLNETGLAKLWQLILNKITNSVKDTVKYTEQTLTDAEKQQVKTNIGITDGEVHIGPEAPTDPNIKMWIDTDSDAGASSAEIRQELEVYSKTEIEELIGDSSSIYVGPEEPEDPEVMVWIDNDAGVDTPEAIRNSINVYSKEETNELINNVQIDVDNEISATGENAVSGAAVAAYVSQEIGKIADYEGSAF